MPYSVVCVCRGPDLVFINLGEGYDDRWWVHSSCEKPREAWLRSMGDDMLNFFRGGDLDGKAYATSTILENQHLMEEYSWTPEVVTSQSTGATARVWQHSSLPNGAQAAPTAERDDLVTTRQEERPMATIAERRKELKISREKLAGLTGFTHSKVWRIEHDSPRTTDEERVAVHRALDNYANDQKVKAQAGSQTSEATAQDHLPGVSSGAATVQDAASVPQ